MSANAQNRQSLPSLPSNQEVMEAPAAKGGSQLSSSFAAILWSQDFAGGIPSTWTQEGTNQIWKWTNKGSVGQYSKPEVTLASTTADNGVIIFDSDSLSTALSDYGPTRTGSLITESIDLTGKPEVKLKFQHFFRLCCSAADAFLNVSVSGDGGASWTDYDVKGTTPINNYPLNPTEASINISQVAGGQSNVKLKFTFAGRAYFWQIDDLRIEESPTNDLILKKGIVDFFYEGGGYYTQLPMSQVGPITFRGIILNDGATDQTNVNLNVDVANSSNSIYNSTSAAYPMLPKYEFDTLNVTSVFTPSAYGAHTVTLTANQSEIESAPVDNIITKVFTVTDTVYSRDNGIPNISSVGPASYINANVDGSAMGNVYEINLNDQASSISVYLAKSTTNGTAITAKLYDASGADILEIANSELYDIIDSTYKDKWVTLPLTMGTKDLVAGSTYIAGIEVMGVSGSSPRVVFAADPTTEQPTGNSLLYNSSTAAWGWISVTPFIRLNTTVTITKTDEAQANLNIVTNRPNPAHNSTTIDFVLKRNESVRVDIYDITGKLVKTISKENMLEGKNSIEISLTDFTNGIYSYTISTGETKISKKFTVIK